MNDNNNSEDPVSPTTTVAFSALEPSPTHQNHEQNSNNIHPPLSWRHFTTASLKTLSSTCPKDSQQPLTVFAKLLIHPGYEQEFEQWYQDITKLQHDHWPGYLSSELVRPIVNSNEYISIFRYDNYQHLEAWMTSSERHSMLQRAKEFSHAPPQLSFHSLEYWFVPPQDLASDDEATVDGQPSSSLEPSSSQPSTAQQPPPQHHHVRPPAKYKMVVVTTLVIWGTNQWTGKVILDIAGKGTLPKAAFQALSTFLTVLVAAYFALPISTALLGFWLFPHQSYMTSLHNGFVSLPWPIPPFVKWLQSKTTTTAQATPTDADQQGNDGDDDNKKNKNEKERNSSVVTAKTEVDHEGHNIRSHTLEIAEDLA